MIEYIRFGGDVGHESKQVEDEEALELINTGLKKGKYILVESEDGTTITSGGAVHEKDAVKGKEKEEAFVTKVKKKLKKKKVKKVTEISAVSGG